MKNSIAKENWDYIINGKQNGGARIIIVGIISVFFVVLTVDQMKHKPNKSLIVATEFCVIALISLLLLTHLIIRFFCFKIYIGKVGFFFQSTPFDGRYYKYTEVKSCKEEIIISRQKTTTGARETTYCYFFVFTLQSGENKRVRFEKSVYEREFAVLKERITDNRTV